MGGHRGVPKESGRRAGATAGSAIAEGRGAQATGKGAEIAEGPSRTKDLRAGSHAWSVSPRRINEATLDQHLDAINTEASGLQAGIEAVERTLSAEDRAAQLRSAESLLATLRTKLASPLSPEIKRRIVEILVERVQADTVERFGVQQSEITIVYRFSQPEEPAALVLPRSHRVINKNRVPEKLETIGDHLLRRRLTLKLIQRQAAKQLGVNVATIVNWENSLKKPKVKYMPAIIRFLGYNPLPPPKGWADRLVQARVAIGLTQKGAAGRIGVEQCTLARWERGEREPTGAFAAQAHRFLKTAEARTYGSSFYPR